DRIIILGPAGRARIECLSIDCDRTGVVTVQEMPLRRKEQPLTSLPDPNGGGAHLRRRTLSEKHLDRLGGPTAGLRHALARYELGGAVFTDAAPREKQPDPVTRRSCRARDPQILC